jgi:hypothetical protein
MTALFTPEEMALYNRAQDAAEHIENQGPTMRCRDLEEDLPTGTPQTWHVTNAGHCQGWFNDAELIEEAKKTYGYVEEETK